MQASNQLSAIASNQLQGLCEFPPDFPDIRFEWVTEDDLQTKLRLEGSAPGTWQLGENFWIRNIQLKAEISKVAPKHESEGKMEGELKVGHNTIPVFYPFPGPFQLVSNLRDIPLEQLILPLEPHTDLFRQIPAFRLREADFACLPHTHAFSLHATTDDSWILPIGREGLPLQQVSLDLEGQGHGYPIEGKLHATIRLNGAETRLTSQVSNASTFFGANENLYLAAILDALCDRPSLRALPAPFDPVLKNATIQIDLTERTVTIQGDAEAFGKTVIVIQEHDGVWGFTAEAELPQRWRLSYMDPFLEPLDSLDQSRTSLIVTSFGASPYPLGEDEEGNTHQALNGYNLLIPTELRGLDELRYLASMMPNPHEVTFLGSFSRREYRPCFTLKTHLQTFPITHGVDLIENEILLRHEEGAPLMLKLTGPVGLHIEDNRLDFTAETRVYGNQAFLEAKLDHPWEAPYGTRGVRLDRLILDVHTGSRGERAIQIVGDCSIQNAKGVTRFYWNEANRDPVVWMSFAKMPSAALLTGLIPGPGALVRPEIRQALEGGFRDVEISLVPQIREIRGDVTLAGARANFEGVFGESIGLDAFGSMEALHWQPVAGGGHVVEMTKGSRHSIQGFPEEFSPKFGGPLLRFYIGEVEQEPAIQVAAECTFFTEYTQSVLAYMTNDGLSFPVEIREDELGALRLECLVRQEGFSANGEIALKLEGDLHLREPKSNQLMGIVGFSGVVRANIRMTIEPTYQATLDGHLVWRNHELEFPTLTLNKPPADLRELREQLTAALDERAYFIFKPLIATEEEFFTAAGDWLQTGRSLGLPVAELTQAVRNAYNANNSSLSVGFHSLGYPTKEVALALKSSNRSPEGLAKALHAVECTPIEIADALHTGFQAPPNVIAQSLRALGYDAPAITNALKMGASTHPVSVAHALKSLGYDPYDIGTAIRSVFLIPVAVAYPIFKTANFKARETIRALVLPYQTGPEETAQLLLGAGYSEREVRTAMDKEMGEADVI